MPPEEPQTVPTAKAGAADASTQDSQPRIASRTTPQGPDIRERLENRLRWQNLQVFLGGGQFARDTLHLFHVDAH
jgi:hypothetical protein